MRPVIRTVIFDIDGTMYDYDACDPSATGAVQKYCREKLGVEQEQFCQALAKAGQMVRQRIGYRCASVHNRLLRYQCMMELWGTPLFPHVQEMQRLYWDTMLEQMKPSAGLTAWMEILKKNGIQIAVGTNMTAEIQYKKLEKLGVSPYVDWLVSSEEAGVEKPDAKFFSQCVEKSGRKPEECLFAGDSLKGDVTPALACGMQALLFSPGSDSCKEAVTAEGRKYYVISSFEECCASGLPVAER